MALTGKEVARCARFYGAAFLKIPRPLRRILLDNIAAVEKPARSYYFGCPGSPMGHHLWQPSSPHPVKERDSGLPFAWHILDGRLLPPGSDLRPNHYKVYRAVVNGWTVLSFWDRSGDDRPNSNSAFLFEGEWSVAEGLQAARDLYPALFLRFPQALEAAS